MYENLKMAELLCTRLCHDLTGPIGAVNNGAEFLSEDGFGMQGQAVELIITSAAQAVTRLQFYRMAYGKINDQGEASLSDTKHITEEFFAGSKIAIDWPDSQTDAAEVSVSRKKARLLLNMIVIASGALIRGGTLSVRLSKKDDGSQVVSVTATGAMIKWDKEVEDAMHARVGLDHITPKTVQAYLTSQLADELRVQLGLDVQETALTIMATTLAG